jgi:hypothetical protein
MGLSYVSDVATKRRRLETVFGFRFSPGCVETLQTGFLLTPLKVLLDCLYGWDFSE